VSPRRVAAIVAAIAGIVAVLVVSTTRPSREPKCGAPFMRAGARCCDTSDVRESVCARSTPPAARGVHVPDTRLLLGPSDWEAEGRVATRIIEVRAFDLDAYEATEAEVHGDAGADRARAASRLSFDDARAYCASRGGRVPTEDEWIAAAAGADARRYPWGDTGAVCRRAAWGLVAGPCATGDPAGPDSVGSHPDGRSPLGIEDLAGNVAEWTIGRERPVVHGGSWKSALATELRTWAGLDLDPTSRDERVGVRCAH